MPTPTTTHISDHEDRGIARLPGYQQSATNWGKLLRALLSEAQSLEDALDQLENERHLSIAVGQQLDEIGTILDLAREGRSDDDYRFALQGQASALAGSGEGNVLIDGYLFLTSATGVLIAEHQPATAELFALLDADTFTSAEDNAITVAMNEIKAAGIQLILVVVNDAATTGFSFLWGDEADADASGDLPTDVSHGRGSSTAAVCTTP